MRREGRTDSQIVEGVPLGIIERRSRPIQRTESKVIPGTAADKTTGLFLSLPEIH
jgi:hypothetical protein